MSKKDRSDRDSLEETNERSSTGMVFDPSLFSSSSRTAGKSESSDDELSRKFQSMMAEFMPSLIDCVKAAVAPTISSSAAPSAAAPTAFSRRSSAMFGSSNVRTTRGDVREGRPINPSLPAHHLLPQVGDTVQVSSFKAPDTGYGDANRPPTVVETRNFLMKYHKYVRKCESNSVTPADVSTCFSPAQLQGMHALAVHAGETCALEDFEGQTLGEFLLRRAGMAGQQTSHERALTLNEKESVVREGEACRRFGTVSRRKIWSYI